jgi:hypothetical protein
MSSLLFFSKTVWKVRAYSFFIKLKNIYKRDRRSINDDTISVTSNGPSSHHDDLSKYFGIELAQASEQHFLW